MTEISHSERMQQLQDELAAHDVGEANEPGITAEEWQRARATTLRRIAEHAAKKPKP